MKIWSENLAMDYINMRELVGITTIKCIDYENELNLK